jgi:hypothetical protein
MATLMLPDSLMLSPELRGPWVKRTVTWPLILWMVSALLHLSCSLTPKGPRPFFGPFLNFGQAIVNAIFVQKIWNFWWTCGLVLALRCTNFYKIPIFNLGAMPQKQNYFEVWAARAAKKLFIFKLVWAEFFFINSLQSS